MKRLPEHITWGEKYDPAMKVQTVEEARAYFEQLVDHCMRLFGETRESAEHIERSNIGYWAGYYDEETRARVYELYDTEHPIFGLRTPTASEAFKMGQDLAKRKKP